MRWSAECFFSLPPQHHQCPSIFNFNKSKHAGIFFSQATLRKRRRFAAFSWCCLLKVTSVRTKVVYKILWPTLTFYGHGEYTFITFNHHEKRRMNYTEEDHGQADVTTFRKTTGRRETALEINDTGEHRQQWKELVAASIAGVNCKMSTWPNPTKAM